MVRLDYIVNPMLNEDREIMAMVTGEPEEAFWHGVAIGKELYATTVPEGMDVAVFNAWPKDTEGFQMGLALAPVRSAPVNLLNDGGTLVLASACSEGAGFHLVLGPGTYLRTKRGTGRGAWPVGDAKDVQAIVFSPGVNRQDVRSLYGDDMPLCQTWPEVLEILQRRHGGSAKVCVFPCGAMQYGVAAK